jgi:hypothetical protein
MVAEIMDAIYKNAVTMRTEFDPNADGKKAREEYTNKLHELFQPVRDVSKEIIDDTIKNLS